MNRSGVFLTMAVLIGFFVSVASIADAERTRRGAPQEGSNARSVTARIENKLQMQAQEVARANQAGLLSREEHAAFQEEQTKTRRLLQEASQDGLISPREREALKAQVQKTDQLIARISQR